MPKQKLLEVKNLKKYFNVGKKQLKAVDNVSFEIYEGETLGLVGESGCGKSTIGRTILNLYQATSGEVNYKGKNLQEKLSKKEKKFYQEEIQMIFQDPYSSLDPRMTVLEIIAEGIKIHQSNMIGKERLERVYELLELVGLDRKHAKRYPHEFSGGQRQRIGIARSLAVNPNLIIADEPIAALDVSIQAQIVNLLKELQKERGLTYLFIAHDLSMVKYISDRVGVMYLGSMVELASSEELYNNPLHPYTKALMSAVPIPDPDIEEKREQIILQGDMPSPLNPPSGCRFITRCPAAMDMCAKLSPEWTEVEKDHFVACHLF
ncbi:oligopeptide ABC transporter ATP-binding protein OppF [Salipaludibacillus neizhouensis]|uniref:Oligopeptide ABC transporter ATP-binding protein OppF n=1 Tax=Salipaludibacillus neizhouensis TaxID=885475 RepID=A0A3A9KQ89_9BACI|nr:oligopeptide/dipeptide ABC transporter ATP-binding protein [Salipaludibacillus neizhouensis]RKL66846.1 oligopeptide ABC transporter ATP-binding protein OppF [Salipaludibacillus neizhouensis]